METARRPASSLFRGLTLPALFLIAAPAFAGAVLSTPDAKQPFAMSHRHAELLQVGVGQLGQDLVVDLVLTEYRRVLFEASDRSHSATSISTSEVVEAHPADYRIARDRTRSVLPSEGRFARFIRQLSGGFAGEFRSYLLNYWLLCKA